MSCTLRHPATAPPAPSAGWRGCGLPGPSCPPCGEECSPPPALLWPGSRALEVCAPRRLGVPVQAQGPRVGSRLSLTGPLVSEGGAVRGRAARQSSKENKASCPSGRPGREGSARGVRACRLGPWCGPAQACLVRPAVRGAPGVGCAGTGPEDAPHPAGLCSITATSLWTSRLQKTAGRGDVYVWGVAPSPESSLPNLLWCLPQWECCFSK